MLYNISTKEIEVTSIKEQENSKEPEDNKLDNDEIDKPVEDNKQNDKIDNNKDKEIDKPVEDNKNEDKPIKDETQTPNKIPQTGSKSIITLVIASICIVIFIRRKIKKIGI